VIADLIARAPSLKVLVTSRVVLRLRAEHEFPVPLLEVPDLSAPVPDWDPTAYPAIQLFAQRARAVDPGFTLGDHNIGAVAEICARVDGLPLAIELAAARIRLMSPQDIVARLQSRLRFLTGGARDLPERHQTLRHTIAWSYELLGAPEQHLFALLAVFAGGCTIEAAEAVCDPDAAFAIDVLDGINALVEGNLVKRDVRRSPDREPRITMLETIREYALELLEKDAQAGAVRVRHRDWYLSLARRAAPALAAAEQDQWLAVLAAEHANLNAALELTIRRGEAGTALAMVAALWRYWLVRGHLIEGRRWLDRALAVPCRKPDLSLRAEVLTGLSTLLHNLDDHVAAGVHASEALEIRRGLGDTAGVARSLADVAWTRWLDCRYDESRDLSNESLRLAESVGDHRGMAQALSNLGWVALYEGRYDEARTMFERGGAARRALNDRRGAAMMTWLLGWTLSRAGEHQRAFALIEEAMAAFRAVGDLRLYAYTLSSVAEAALRTGDVRRARSVLESEALPIFRRYSDQWGIAHALALLSWVTREQGDLDRAEAMAIESREIREAIHNRHGVAQALAHLGFIARLRGDETLARQRFEESLAIRREIGDRVGVDECESALTAAITAR
jgi:predicted ATPase